MNNSLARLLDGDAAMFLHVLSYCDKYTLHRKMCLLNHACKKIIHNMPHLFEEMRYNYVSKIAYSKYMNTEAFAKYVRILRLGDYCGMQLEEILAKFAAQVQEMHLELEKENLKLFSAATFEKLQHLHLEFSLKNLHYLTHVLVSPNLKILSLAHPLFDDSDMEDTKILIEMAPYMSKLEKIYCAELALTAIQYKQWLDACPSIGKQIYSISISPDDSATAHVLSQCPNLTILRITCYKANIVHMDAALVSNFIRGLGNLQEVSFGGVHIPPNMIEQIFAGWPTSITKLYLYKLKFDVFPDMSYLVKLQSLICTAIEMKQPLPNWLGKMPTLKLLHWPQYNNAVSVRFSNTTLPPKLQEFKASALQDINGCAIFKNCKVRNLELERMSFELDETSVSYFDHLNRIFLKESQHHASWNMSTWNKMSLAQVELINCSIVDFPIDLLKLSSLTSLNLMNNKITAIPPELISGECCSELQTLKLSKNDVALPPDFSNHPSLRECSLNDNPRLESYWMKCKQYGNSTMEIITLALLQLMEENCSIDNKTSLIETVAGCVLDLVPIRDEYHFVIFASVKKPCAATQVYSFANRYKLVTTQHFKLLCFGNMPYAKSSLKQSDYEIYKK